MSEQDATPQARARQMRDDGRSTQHIASVLGVHRSTVNRWLKDDGRGVMQVAQRARVTTDFPSMMSAATLTARTPDAVRDIAMMNKAGLAFDGLSGVDFVKLALRISPEISRAVWDFQRMLNPGHEIDVFYPGTEDEYPEAKAALDAFTDMLANRYGSFKVLTGKLFLSAITRGAFFAELVLDDTGTQLVDYVIPDPAIVEFRTRDDELRGIVWEIGQRVKGEFVSLERPTIRYIALDEDTTSPYGTSMLYPAVFPAMFLIGLMYDLRRVIAQQGYQHGDVSIDVEKTKAMKPLEDDETFTTRLQELRDSINSAFMHLEPDQIFTHTDNVTVNHSDGIVDSSSLAGAATVINAMERMLVRALKTMPLMMGIPDAVGDANASRQWEIYTRSIKELQQYAENLMEYHFQLGLGILGFQADVRVRFAELRYAEELRDAQVVNQKLVNAQLMEQLGYEDQDTASEYAVGHPPVGERAAGALDPASNPSATAPPINPEPQTGSNSVRTRGTEPFKPADDDEPEDLDPVTHLTRSDMQRALGAWNTSVPGHKNLIDASSA
jgi:hypothetical protein